MGGKALNKYGVFTERKTTDEFTKIGLELQQNIYADLHLTAAIVKCYHTKASHGDLDLLIKMNQFTNINWREYIDKTFKPLAIHNNGGVFSFDIRNFKLI